MSVVYVASIFCDECSECVEGDAAVTAVAARRKARRRGWKRIRTPNGMMDLCPACAAARSKQVRSQRKEQA